MKRWDLLVFPQIAQTSVCPVNATKKDEEKQQNVVMWLSTGSCDSQWLLDEGPVPPMMTKVSGKCLFQAVGFCPVWFNVVISNQIKGLKRVFPVRNVGQTCHVSVSASQPAHWFTLFIYFFVQSTVPTVWFHVQWERRSRNWRLYSISHQNKSYKAGFGTCMCVWSSLDQACLLVGTLNCLQMQNFSKIFGH